jgi:hypothetical protein
MWRLDHTTEVLPSNATEARAIMTAAGEIHYADVWIENYYRRGGIKASIVAMKGMVSPEKREDEENKWTQFLRGIGLWRNKNVRVVNAEALDVKAFGDGVADLENNEVYRQAIANIAMGIGMPLSLLLSNSANYATAEEEKQIWFKHDIGPFCNWLAYEYNRQLFAPMGLRLEFRPEAVEGAQQDEMATAQAFSTYGDTFAKYPTYELWKGMADTLGLEVADSLDKAAQAYYKDKAARAEEVRQQMEQKPPEPAPVEQLEIEEDDEEKEARPRSPAKWIPTLDELDELKTWRKAALQRLKRGESLDFEYLPHYGGLPESVTADIKARLPLATDAEQVKAIFEIEQPEPQAPNEIILLAGAINSLAEKMMLPVST